MKEKYNFKIDPQQKSVLIEVPTSIYPVSVILHAAYVFIEEAKVIVEEGGDNKIIVNFIPEGKVEEKDLEELAYQFNVQLISSFCEEVESRKYAQTRNALMRAALTPQTQRPQGRPPPTNTQGP